MSISDDTLQSSATSSETEDTAKTLPAENLLLSSDAGREPKRRPVSKRRLPTDEIQCVLEGEIRIAREIREHHRRQGFEAFHHQERQFEKAAVRH